MPVTMKIMSTIFLLASAVTAFSGDATIPAKVGTWKSGTISVVTLITPIITDSGNLVQHIKNGFVELMVPFAKCERVEFLQSLISKSKLPDAEVIKKVPMGLFSEKCIAVNINDKWMLITIDEGFVIVEEGNEVIGGMFERKSSGKALYCLDPSIVKEANSLYSQYK